MARATVWFAILVLTAALPLPAQSQPQESLGTLARQLRKQREEEAKKPVKVFTNDNLPPASQWEPVNNQVGPPPAPEQPSAPAEKNTKATTPAASDQSQKESGSQSESPQDKVKTRGYWQEKFKTARENLANAEKTRQLAQDELNLLQLQQLREADPNVKADLGTRVDAKQAEVDADHAASDAAQKALDDLEKEFKDSGAPEEWSPAA